MDPELKKDLDDAAKLLKDLAKEQRSVVHRASVAFCLLTLVKARKALAFFESEGSKPS